MAALTTYSGSTEFANTIPAETISQFVQSYDWAPLVAEEIAWADELPQGGGDTKAFPKFDVTSQPAGNVTESDTLTDVAWSMSEETIQVGVVGARYPISYEGRQDSQMMVPTRPLIEAVRALRNRWDQDILASVTSATGTATGDTGTAMDYARFLAGLEDFYDLNPPEGQIVFVTTVASWFAIQTDLQNGTAVQYARAPNDLTTQGFVGRLNGVDCFVSQNCPDEGVGKSSCFTVQGDERSALGLLVSWGITIEDVPSEDRLVRYLKVHSRYGTGLTGAPIQEVLSAA